MIRLLVTCNVRKVRDVQMEFREHARSKSKKRTRQIEARELVPLQSTCAHLQRLPVVQCRGVRAG